MPSDKPDTAPYEAVVAGHLCIDLAPTLAPGELSAQLRPGKLVHVGPMTVTTGGVVSNTGLPLLSMGIRAALVGCVGDDAIADLTVRYLRARGGDAGIRVKPGVGSSYTVALAPPGADRVFLHHPGVNDAFAKDDIDWDAVAGARLFHFGYPPLMRGMYADGGEALAAMMREARARGMATSLDLALPDPDSDAGRADWAAILARALPHVDICLPSIEELLYAFDRSRYEALRAAPEGFIDALTARDVEDAAGRLIDAGVAIAVVKLGHRGLYGRTAGAARMAGMGWGDGIGAHHGSVADDEHDAPHTNARYTPSRDAIEADAPRVNTLDADRRSTIDASARDTRSAADHAAAWSDRSLFRPSYRATVHSTSGAGDCCIAGFLAALLRGYGLETCLDVACLAGAMKVEQAGSVGEMPPIARMVEAIGRDRNDAAWGNRTGSIREGDSFSQTR